MMCFVHSNSAVALRRVDNEKRDEDRAEQIDPHGWRNMKHDYCRKAIEQSTEVWIHEAHAPRSSCPCYPVCLAVRSSPSVKHSESHRRSAVKGFLVT